MNYRKLMVWLYGGNFILFTIELILSIYFWNSFSKCPNFIILLPFYLFILTCLITPFLSFKNYKQEKNRANFWLIMLTTIILILTLVIFIFLKVMGFRI
ncbi:MAG: hypothetical protein PHR48_00325 [Candidatus ainarchaeum sp.]|nr:hypothetical protein [Candidatus ainarchaeum sp.]